VRYFCQIVAGNIPSTILYRDEELIAFCDISPKTSTHLLIILKKHILLWLTYLMQNYP
jgi:histidine triad (HIT) family protein